MKLLVFLIFAGCAVKCDEPGSYYVIERPNDAPTEEPRPFQVYWNVPTFQCRSKKVVFDHLFQKYGIIQNQNDTFQGEQITILYDPGLFPAILKEESSGRLRTRNGGVPQEGNLDEHLTAFRYVLDQSIPDPEFSGIGVIDFESWRPIFRQNFWGVLIPYKNLSLHIERQLHPWWTKSMIEKQAKIRFERAGREFMQATLALARLLRPQAKWGYYGFPYCFNMAGAKPAETCSDVIQNENDQITWLWAESLALYPSVYSSKNLSSAQLAGLIRGRVAESRRVARGMPILPYFWFKYRDAGFMSEVDLKTAIKAMYKSHTSGFIVWGSSNDVNTVKRCEKLKNYLEHVLGPEIAKYTKETHKIGESSNISNKTEPNNCSTQNPFFLMTTDPKDDENKKPDSENEEMDENSETMQSHLDDIVTSRNENGSAKDTNENNILIEIVMSLIENIQKKFDKDTKKATKSKISKNRKKGTPIHDTFTQINDNEVDFTTKNPFDSFKKKSAHFAFLYPPKHTTVLEHFTSITADNLTSNNDLKTTTLEITSTTQDSLGSGHNFKSTTVNMLYDDENSTNLNQGTFLDEMFNDTTESVTEDTSSISYKEVVTTDFNRDTFLDEMFNDTTESVTVKTSTVPYKEGETTVRIFFENASDYTLPTESTTNNFNNGESTTEPKTIKYKYLTDNKRSTSRTTTEYEQVNDAVNDDFESQDYQVVMNLD